MILTKTTKNFKIFALILLTSALLLVAINPSIPTVKAATTDSIYVYTSVGGTISQSGTSLTGGDTYKYTNDTTVNFLATPSSGFKFLCWEYASSAGGVVSTVNPLALTPTESEYGIQAMYLPTTNATLSSSTTTGTTSVDILTSISGATSPTAGTYTNYTLGKVASFSVIPGKGFKFLYWIVSCTPGTFTTTSSTLSFTLSASSYFAIQAMFVPTSSTVTINEFSSATVIIIVAVLAIVAFAFGVYAYTKKAKK